MAATISEVHDALCDAEGGSDAKARKAAEAVASFDAWFATMENEMTRLAGELAILKWMTGFGLALNVAILLKLFVHG